MNPERIKREQKRLEKEIDQFAENATLIILVLYAVVTVAVIGIVLFLRLGNGS